MSEGTILWLFGTIIALQTTALGALGVALWTHVGHCKDVASKLAEIGSDVKRLKEDVGDHDHGIRGDIREHTSLLFRLDSRVESLEERQEHQR